MKIFYLEKDLEKSFNKNFILQIHDTFLQNIEKSKNKNYELILQSIQKIFNIEKSINVINIFDNSQFYYQYKLGGMVYWDLKNNFIKEKYKVFKFHDNINSDYEMMKVVFRERILSIQKNKEIVDLFLIDGGLIQKNALLEIMKELSFDIEFICIAKGKNRNARDETFFCKYENEIKLERNSNEIIFLEKLRDEAHHFIINKIRNKKNQEIKKIKQIFDA